MTNVKLYQWPESQICITCWHGCFIQSQYQDLGDSVYVCIKDSDKNNGVNCSDKYEGEPALEEDSTNFSNSVY